MSTPTQRDWPGRRRNKETRLLVIEDNPDHGMLIQNAIRQCMPTVTSIVVTTEAAAVAYLQECVNDIWKVPKMIFLDLYLPDRETGWRVLDKIRAVSDSLGKLPVVLLSYSTCRADITEAYDRGCSSYLSKPEAVADWVTYLDAIRTYWLETVTLPDKHKGQ